MDLHRQPHNPTYLAHYFEGPQPEGVYLYQLHEDPTARWLAQQKLALVAKWLAGQPEDRALPKDAVKAVLDQERCAGPGPGSVLRGFAVLRGCVSA